MGSKGFVWGPDGLGDSEEVVGAALPREELQSAGRQVKNDKSHDDVNNNEANKQESPSVVTSMFSVK